jgi:hypothetical protein
MTNTSYVAEGHGSLVVLALLALIVGAAAGLVGAIFRLTLQQADRLRDALIAIVRAARAAVSHPHLASVLQQGLKSANIRVSLGVIRGILA